MKRRKISSCIALGAILGTVQSGAIAQTPSVGDVETRFCNDGNTTGELDLITKAGKTTSICMEFNNPTKMPITLNIEFLDSAITADTYQERGCNASDRPKVQFGNFMLPYTGGFTIPAQQTVKKTYAIKYPIGFSGLSHGCIAYYKAGADMDNGGMFSVRVRAVRFVDVMVSDTQAIQGLSISKRPTLTKVDDEYVITMGIHNNGNVDEQMAITGRISNILGFSHDILLAGRVPAQSGSLFTSKGFLLPGYGGLFLLKSEITYIPQLNFNIDNPIKASGIYKEGTKTIRHILFVRTRGSGTLLAILLGFLFIILRRQIKNKIK